MDIYAYYLPQYHQTKENDKWWGEGFTEWCNIKKAQPLFSGHEQPKVPLNRNYYDLSDVEVMKWQGQLARKYGVSGFCVYHYWFEGRKLLHKPMEQLLKHKEIDFPYFFCWANESWTNAWATSKGKPRVLMQQTYGTKESWEKHFQYLLTFFRDERYIKKDNKPLFVIYRPEIISCLNEMLDYFQKRAIEVGYNGLCIISQQVYYLVNGADNSRFDYRIEYQPSYSEYKCASKLRNTINRMEENLMRFLNDRLHIATPKIKKLQIKSFDKLWQEAIQHKPIDSKVVPGAFVGWDNTPRYGKNGYVVHGGNPKKFYHYLRLLIRKTKQEYKKDMIFVFAWNEWTEGGYLEPDERYGYGYLKAIRRALEAEGEIQIPRL
ncbi:MAG: glycoside hydrolase family 99-like domain-containing protein [Lachnospiraceae bacterium]|nr:glycoside hydrolase family 99-like domain-containing protein [Lachnospiraceae bacterium]